MSLPTPEELRGWLADAIECDHLQVAGDGRHFEALLVSSAFVGMSKVRRHQLVYRALGGRMKEQIHALSMRTLTPEEWKTA